MIRQMPLFQLFQQITGNVFRKKIYSKISLRSSIFKIALRSIIVAYSFVNLFLAWNLRKNVLDFGAPFFGFEVLAFLSNFFALNLSFVVLWLKQLFSWHVSNGKSGLAYSSTQPISFTNGQSSSVSLFVSSSSLFIFLLL